MEIKEARTVLVTGKDGMLATALAEYVKSLSLESEFKYVGYEDADLTDYSQTKNVFAKFQPSHVIHLLSLNKGLYYRLDNQVKIMIKTQSINQNISKACAKFGVHFTLHRLRNA
ncbi:putative GDP-L-fucose synthase [Thelohanellus kitauei]|uniref:Putative GDP-L-fucose synthase n=1 Tax=Thelohanellus kitauei TaxID=669202 RepID=A0A0C2MHN0_THEKT|nr:putative GDP-L-fucose synthase [Thelohanellus kitauei]